MWDQNQPHIINGSIIKDVLLNPDKNSKCDGIEEEESDLKYEDIDQDLVPCNKEQYDAIKNIGVWTLNIIHGPPGTGKSTTIFNGVRYRLPENAKAMAVSQNNQAIGALIEKFKKTYEALPDPGDYIAKECNAKFSFLVLGSKKQLSDESKPFHFDEIVDKLIEKRVDIKQYRGKWLDIEKQYFKDENTLFDAIENNHILQLDFSFLKLKSPLQSK